MPLASASAESLGEGSDGRGDDDLVARLGDLPAPLRRGAETVEPTSDSTSHTWPTASSEPPTITLERPDSAPATPPTERGVDDADPVTGEALGERGDGDR